MKEALAKLREFHSKHGFAVDMKMTNASPERMQALLRVGEFLVGMSAELENVNDDIALQRAHLIIEEAGEMFTAIAKGNVVEAVDGLTDLLYVVLGTAVAFGVPLAEAFDEVHKSNMTKTAQPTDPAAHRLRSKGPDYRAPDIRRVLQETGYSEF